MAEVVVADGIARQPGVLRWEVPALEHCVHEPEIHGLLGVVDGGYLGDDAQPHQEEPKEQDLRGHQHLPMLAQKVFDLPQKATPQKCAGDGRHNQDKDEGQLGVGSDVGQAEDPEDIGEEHHGGGFG